MNEMYPGNDIGSVEQSQNSHYPDGSRGSVVPPHTLSGSLRDPTISFASGGMPFKVQPWMMEFRKKAVEDFYTRNPDRRPLSGSTE